MAAGIHQPTISMESASSKRSSSPSRKRRKILHTCTISMLATAERVSSKATMLNVNGPVGFVVNRCIQFITTRGPFVGLYKFQTHIILTIMSFLDDRILKVVNVVEDHFPCSSYVFDKIDNAVCFTETLPTKVDEAVDMLSGAVNKFNVRNCFQRIMDLLILMRSVLAAWWGSEFALTKERDIMVDTNCSENRQRMTKKVVCDEAFCQIEPTMTVSSHTITSIPDKLHILDESQEPDRKTLEDKHDDIKEESSDKIRKVSEATKISEENVPKCSYKEVLEKGNSFKEVVEKGSSYKEVLEKGTKEESKEQSNEEATEDDNNREDLKTVAVGNDPILELFESAWHMT